MFLIDPYRFGTAGASADPYWSNVVLLVGADGADGATTFRDDSPSGHTLTANGNAQIDTAQYQYGNASALFDGTGDYITAPDSADWDWGTGDVTIECWARFDGSGDRDIISRWDGFSGGNAFQLGIKSGNLEWTIYTGGLIVTASAAFTPTAGVWYYIAAQRVNLGNGNNYLRLHTGVAGGSATLLASQSFNYADPIQNITAALYIGRLADTSPIDYYQGWIDEIRITKGVARYGSGTFTVPTAAFPRTLSFSGVPVIASANGFYGVGDTLTVTDAGYSNAISSARVWKADGVDIGGATGTSFVLTSSELGKQITVRQTITAPDSATLSADSAATPVVITPTFLTDTRITTGGDTRITTGSDTRVIQTRIA